MKKTQLFLLHFAGGNCYSYHFLRPFLSQLELIPVELPGRGKRNSEPLLKEFDAACEDVFQQIAQRVTSPNFLIFGHSMGALLGLKVTAMLEQAGLRPLQLIVSGNAGPGLRESKHRYLLSEDDFKAELRAIGGVPDELLNNKEMLSFFEPVLRADFEVIEKKPLQPFAPVAAPILALMGDQEEDVPKIDNWQKYTTGGFSHRILPGNHFFIYDHAPALAGLLYDCQAQAITC